MGRVLREERNARLEGHNDALARIVFADGTAFRRGAVFVQPEQQPRTELAVSLGCDLSDAAWRTTVPGVYAAGDVATPTQ